MPNEDSYSRPTDAETMHEHLTHVEIVSYLITLLIMIMNLIKYLSGVNETRQSEKWDREED